MGGAADLSAVSEQLQARSEELNQSLAQADAASHTAHQVNRGASGLVKEVGKVIPLLTTAADLKQAEVGRTIDEATDRQKDAAKRDDGFYVVCKSCINFIFTLLHQFPP